MSPFIKYPIEVYPTILVPDMKHITKMFDHLYHRFFILFNNTLNFMVSS